jgi:hypothetical protein
MLGRLTRVGRSHRRAQRNFANRRRFHRPKQPAILEMDPSWQIWVRVSNLRGHGSAGGRAARITPMFLAGSVASIEYYAHDCHEEGRWRRSAKMRNGT